MNNAVPKRRRGGGANMVNLFLALLWLLLGAFVFVWPVLHPEARLPPLMGWAALGMVLYNVVRAWRTLRARAVRRRHALAERDHDAPRPKRIVNPTLDFTERPPRKGN
jgi:hypothetical protein